MPSAQNDNLNINYEIRGKGPPAVLFNHSGASGLAWRELFLETLAPHLTVITIDSRGTGYSSPAAKEFVLSDIASDGLAVLEAEGIETAVIIGTSLGGAVAQEFALAYPDCVSTLILLGTFAGSANFVMPDASVLELLQPPPGTESKVKRIRRMLGATFASGFLERHEDLALELELKGNRFTTDETIKRHRVAVGKFEAYDRLSSISAPTMIIHGKEDPVIPIANGEILAGQISNSKFVSLDGVGHLPATERPLETAEHIISFVSMCAISDR